MIVDNWMSRPVVTISHKSTMEIAINLMKQYKIRALPVIRDDILVGLLTEKDLKQAAASDATTLDIHELHYLLGKITVAEIMTADPKTISIDSTLSEAADLFLEHKLEAAPVMSDKDKLVGILTQSDLDRAILKLTSFGRRGVQFGIRVSDTPNAIMDLISIVREARARLASLITSDGSEQNATRDAYLHIYDLNRAVLQDMIRQLNEKGALLYMVDLKTDERHIFNRSV